MNKNPKVPMLKPNVFKRLKAKRKRLEKKGIIRSLVKLWPKG